MTKILIYAMVVVSSFFAIVSRNFASEPCKVLRVVDGDTIVISMEGAVEQKIRLCEIDAPEIHQAYGWESKLELEKILNGKEISIDIEGHDIYGRTLGKVYANGQNVGLMMIKSGFAWPYKTSSPDQFYRYAMYAQWKHIGLWESEEPIAPWVWRKEQKGKK